MLNWRQTYELARVRVKLFFREPEAVFWVLVFPLVLAMILGWAFKQRPVEAQKIAVLSPTAAGVEVQPLLASLRGDAQLLIETIASAEDGERKLRYGHIAALVLPGPPLKLRYDPGRPEAAITSLRVEQALRRALAGAPAKVFEVEEVHETGSRYIDWLFPGLLGMNLMGTGIWGIGFALADMRQKKLLRRYLVTPMRKTSLLASFLCSRLVFLVLELSTLGAFAFLVLGVPMRGNVASFAVACLLGMLTFASAGLLIVSRARTLEAVSGIMNLFMMPMWLLSGVFFAYDRFPEAAHPFIRLLPLTALNDALRAIVLEGASLASLWMELGVLGAWAAVSFVLALKIFRWE
ncbi:MAG: ABC transporter permease [Planctomycetota bacterium]